MNLGEYLKPTARHLDVPTSLEKYSPMQYKRAGRSGGSGGTDGGGGGAGAPAGFDPETYGTVREWFDPTQGVLDAGLGMQTWTGQVNSNVLTQLIDTSRPGTGNFTENSLNVIDFDETEFISGSLGANLTRDYSIYLVCRFGNLNQAAGNWDMVTDFEDTGGTQRRSGIGRSRSDAPADTFTTTDGGGSLRDSTSPPITGQVWHILGLDVTTASPFQQGYIDNVAAAAFGGLGASGDSNSTLHVGQAATANHPFLGRLGDIIVYEGILASQDRTDLYNALVTRWGL